MISILSCALDSKLQSIYAKQSNKNTCSGSIRLIPASLNQSFFPLIFPSSIILISYILELILEATKAEGTPTMMVQYSDMPICHLSAANSIHKVSRNSGVYVSTDCHCLRIPSALAAILSQSLLKGKMMGLPSIQEITPNKYNSTNPGQQGRRWKESGTTQGGDGGKICRNGRKVHNDRRKVVIHGKPNGKSIREHGRHDEEINRDAVESFNGDY
ncbi:hypothetical protein M5K25_002368 [Dendrobium thyrsiflorum]|uniref:Uncharacterized protein n=1 Tax=Dendrobium thyrsiflorum TaxID=117978 RepID=A0ABD0VU87_DENTH